MTNYTARESNLVCDHLLIRYPKYKIKVEKNEFILSKNAKLFVKYNINTFYSLGTHYCSVFCIINLKKNRNFEYRIFRYQWENDYFFFIESWLIKNYFFHSSQ